MLRSLMTAVTGVRAHQTMLDVTGNNIANANTVGFKKDFTIFADLMYQANKNATNASDGRGGTNPAQVGLGVSVASIETIYTQGSSSYTGSTSDMMIQGSGFFVYRDGSNTYYSRSGATVRDGNNDLVLSGSGYYLQGYKMSEDPLNPSTYTRDDQLSNINIPIGKKLEAKATSEVKYQCNLDSRSDAYLPYGFADLPFNTYTGWPNNDAGTSQVSIAGYTCDISFKSLSNLQSSSISTEDETEDEETVKSSEAGANYLEIAINDGIQTNYILFDMTGINTITGKPSLDLSKVITVANNASEGEPSDSEVTIPDNVITLGSTGAPKYLAVEWDDDAGTLKLRNWELPSEEVTVDEEEGYEVTGSSVEFEYDIKSRMNYSSFILNDSSSGGNGTDYYFLAEFDESVINVNVNSKADGSDMSKVHSTLTLWFEVPSRVPVRDENGNVQYDDDYNIEYQDIGEDGIQLYDAEGNRVEYSGMAKMTAEVYFNADGTFADVGEISSGLYLDENHTIELFPGAFDASTFKIVPSEASGNVKAGQYLNIQGAVDPTNASSRMDTVSQIGIGGFHQSKTTIYDDNGKEHTLEVNFKKVTENRWRWEAFILDEDGNQTDIIPEPRTGEIEFDGSGQISNAVANNNKGTPNGTFTRHGTNDNSNARVEINVPFSLNGQGNSTITLNFGGDGDALNGITQFASATTTKSIYQNGYTMGILEDYSIRGDGTITGSYSNGQNIPMYRIALATFANEQGLEKVGDTAFRETANSGTANIDPAGEGSKGEIKSQYLEMSNVDLTEEFTHLILSQRGFQANSRVITTSDQILEEVVNLKR